MLSGSSAVNYCCWTRGHRADYDSWAKLVGDDRWNYENLLPFFKKSESYHDGDFDKEQHGYDGPIRTTQGGKGYLLETPMRRALEEIGLKYTPDMNGGLPNGICQIIENWVDGQRQPAGVVYSLDGVYLITNT